MSGKWQNTKIRILFDLVQKNTIYVSKFFPIHVLNIQVNVLRMLIELGYQTFTLL